MSLRDVSVLIGSMFVLLLAVAAFAIAADLSRHADRCEWAAFDLCVMSTGESLPGFVFDGFSTVGTETIRFSDVIGVVPLASTDKCVLIERTSMKTASVIGSYDEVMLKLNPVGCKR